jgi:hypothetical protein
MTDKLKQTKSDSSSNQRNALVSIKNLHNAWKSACEGNRNFDNWDNNNWNKVNQAYEEATSSIEELIDHISGMYCYYEGPIHQPYPRCVCRKCIEKKISEWNKKIDAQQGEINE